MSLLAASLHYGCVIRVKMDSPLEEWLIKEAGVRTSSDWISACIRWIAANNPNQLTPVELQHAVLERWLVTDIAESGLPILPSDQFTTLTNMALQVNWVCDVSRSAYQQLQLLRGQDIAAEEEGVGTPAAKRAKEQLVRPSRMLLAEMTDGHSVVNAIEYQPMGPALNEDIPPGTKVHVLAAVCQKGTVLLVPGCLRVLGGGVESMAAANSLESVLNRAIEQAKQPQREPSGGQPRREPLGGQPRREPSGGQLEREPSGGQLHSTTSGSHDSELMSPGQVKWGWRGDQPLRMQSLSSACHTGNVEEHESANFTSFSHGVGNQHCSDPPGAGDEPSALGSAGSHSPWDTGATIPTHPVHHQPSPSRPGSTVRSSNSPGPHPHRPFPPGPHPHRPHSPRPFPHGPHPHRSHSPGPHPHRSHSPRLFPHGPHPHRSHSPGPHPHRPHSPGPHPHRPHSPGPHPHTPHSPGPHPHRPHSPGPHPHRPHSPGPHPHRPHSPGPHPHRSHSPRPFPRGPHSHRSLSPVPRPYRPLPLQPHHNRSHSPGSHHHRPHSPGPLPHRPHSPGPRPHRPHSPGPRPHGPHSPGPRPHRPLPSGLHANHHTPWDSGGSLPSQPVHYPQPHPQVDECKYATEHHNGRCPGPQREIPWSRDHRSAHPHQSRGLHSSVPLRTGPPQTGPAPTRATHGW